MTGALLKGCGVCVQSISSAPAIRRAEKLLGTGTSIMFSIPHGVEKVFWRVDAMLNGVYGVTRSWTKRCLCEEQH